MMGFELHKDQMSNSVEQQIWRVIFETASPNTCATYETKDEGFNSEGRKNSEVII